jgi:hypothetical protein
MPAFLTMSLLFTLAAVFFSVALVDWPRATQYHRQNFTRRDLLWAGVVACSILWPLALIYAMPYWTVAAVCTAFCAVVTYELMYPVVDVKDWGVFQHTPKAAWFILGFFSMLSTWMTLLYFFTEEAQGRLHPGLIPNFFG